MTTFLAPEIMTAPADADRAALRARLAGTNINPDTLLATDYLNHFNEVVMMLDLVADMPEMLDDAKAWKPLSYVEHFRQSQFAEKDLAIEAYALIPDDRRAQFEEAVSQTHARVAGGLGALYAIIGAGGDAGRLRNETMAISRDLHQLIDRINAFIHGGAAALEQPAIDGLFSDTPGPGTASQDDIDNLFK
jgi:hypothetical protein